MIFWNQSICHLRTNSSSSLRGTYDLYKTYLTFLFGGVRKYSTNTHILKTDRKLPHIPVLSYQVTEFLQPDKCDLILDATFGAGGHTRKLLEQSKKVKIFCLDRDPEAFAYAVELQDEFPDQIVPMHGKFSDLPKLLTSHNILQNSLDGILFDFGVSSMQFDNPERGFSLKLDGPLDMRMDGIGSDNITGAHVLAFASETELSHLFRLYGEEKYGKKIARSLLEARHSYKAPSRTGEFRDLICSSFSSPLSVDSFGKYTHVATKAFMALRAFVNNEVNEVDHAMVLAHRFLKIGGRLVTLTCNIFEDKIVKNHITGVSSERAQVNLPLEYYNICKTYDFESMNELKELKWKPINKHAISPSRYEQDVNPRSRITKLRASIKMV